MTVPLKCRIETAFAPQDPLRSEWDRLALALVSPIYMSYDWVRLWWMYYGGNGELRVFIFFKGEDLVGIVPMYLSKVGFRPFRITVARVVGANIPPKVFNPPVLGEIAEGLWEHVMHHLFNVERCDVVSLGPVSETYSAFDGL